MTLNLNLECARMDLLEYNTILIEKIENLMTPPDEHCILPLKARKVDVGIFRNFESYEKFEIALH